MIPRYWPGAIAWLLFALALMLMVLSFAFVLATPASDSPQALGRLKPALLGFMAYPAVGAVIATRRPRNPIAWILLVSGLSYASWEIVISFVPYVVFAAPTHPPAIDVVAALFAWMWAGPSLAALALLFFPDGRLPSRRWAPAAWLYVAIIGLMIGVGAVLPGPVLNMPYINNPLGVEPFAPLRAYSADTFKPVAALWVVFVVSLVQRFRRAGGLEREQLKWVAFAGAVLIFGVILLQLFVSSPLRTLDPSTPAYAAEVLYGIPAAALFAAFPVAIAFAVLRYRLYDIDLLINRGLVYGLTSGAIAATFFGGIVVLQAALRPLVSGSELAVATSTLVSFALFHPLRARVQAAVDRRFYRSRYDAGRTLDVFATRLRDEVDLDELRSDLLEVIGDTVRPSHAAVWLRRVG